MMSRKFDQNCPDAEGGVMSRVGLSKGHGNGLEALDFGSLSRQLDLHRKKNRFLKKIGLAIIVLLALLAYWFHDYFVGSYAMLENVSITQDASKPRATRSHETNLPNSQLI
jgi:hypothetical protein